MAWTLEFTAVRAPRVGTWQKSFKRRPDSAAITREFRAGSGYRGRRLTDAVRYWTANGVGEIFDVRCNQIGSFKVVSNGNRWD